MAKRSGPTGYCLKPNYESRATASYYDDAPGDLRWQPDVYRLAHHFARRSEVRYVVDIGAGSGTKLAPIARERRAIVIDHGRNLGRSRETLGGGHTFLEHDLETGTPSIEDGVLRDAVVICADVIEHLVDPTYLLEALADYSRRAKFVLLSTPDRVRGDGIGDFGPPANPAHVREWAIDELDALLRSYDFDRFMLGYTISNDRDRLKHTALAVSGVLARPPRAEHAKALTLTSAAEPRTAGQDWRVLETEDGSLSSPWPGVSLADALSAVAAHGYDAVTTTVLDVLADERDGPRFCFGDSIERFAVRADGARTFPLNFMLVRDRGVASARMRERRRDHDYYPPTLRSDYLVELLAGPGDIERGT